MSLNSKLAAAKELVSVFRKWPDDTDKIYKSFRNVQIGLYDSKSASSLPNVSSDVLQARAAAATSLLEDANHKKFLTGQKLLHPDGQPAYYERITREANRTSKKVGVWQGIQDAVFGWYKF